MPKLTNKEKLKVIDYIMQKENCTYSEAQEIFAKMNQKERAKIARSKK